MSMMSCESCAKLVDTDFDLGSWGMEELDEDHFWCTSCANDQIDIKEHDAESQERGEP